MFQYPFPDKFMILGPKVRDETGDPEGQQHYPAFTPAGCKKGINKFATAANNAKNIWCSWFNICTTWLLCVTLQASMSHVKTFYTSSFQHSDSIQVQLRYITSTYTFIAAIAISCML